MRISDWSSDVCSSDLAAGADFAYLFATDGDARVDPTYARNMAAAREAGIRTGPIHRYNLCKLATDQAANFIRHVPRRADALPPVVWLDYDDRCPDRSEEHTSELQSLMRISYAVFCLKKKKK